MYTNIKLFSLTNKLKPAYFTSGIEREVTEMDALRVELKLSLKWKRSDSEWALKEHNNGTNREERGMVMSNQMEKLMKKKDHHVWYESNTKLNTNQKVAET